MLCRRVFNSRRDGKNESGEPVSQGVYIYVIKTADGGKKIGKVGVLK
jgi:hypothetical protein